ncbi:hypothetical protein HYR99_24040 [Candidatus Poribacteria bacterium]|nr:hypothetical protein [Candidatus Poribacteria bacterium]
MAFTIEDYHDLVSLLEKHPEWKMELRRLLLPDELLSLPEIVRELAQAQQRTEERLNALAEAQQHTEESLNALAQAQQHLTERVDALTERVDALAEGQQRLIEEQRRLTNRVGEMRGDMLEITYARRAGGYFGRLLSRVKVVEPHTLKETLKTMLTPDEYYDVFLLDLLVTGKLDQDPDSPDVWLAMEISSMVDRTDVERAARRAGLLRRAGYRAIPVVAGAGVTQGGEAAARKQNVVLLQDGQMDFWDAALSAWDNV